MKPGGNAQDRRRVRRAAERRLARNAETLTAADISTFQALAAEATAPILPEDTVLARLDAAQPQLDGNWNDEGFLDLIADVNASLGENVRAIDASVKLDKVFVYETDSDPENATQTRFWVAPLTIGVDGMPVVGDRSAWAQQPTSNAAMRFTLTDFTFAAETIVPPEMAPGERLPERTPSPELPAVELAPRGPLAWTALFVPEGTLTDDGRAMAPGSLEWRELPLSLMAMTGTSAAGGHDGAELAGRIDRIWREGSLIMAAGIFDGGEFGTDIARQVGDRTLRGLSVDIAIHEYEVGAKSDYFDDDGQWVGKQESEEEASERSLEDILFGTEESEQQVFVVTKGVIGMATVCPFPAFAEANISLQASGAIWRYTAQGSITVVEQAAPALVAAAIAPEVDAEVEETEPEVPASGNIPVLTAAAAGLAPTKPPREWFTNPELSELTPLTVDDDGRIYGHAWGWETCHTGIPGTCTTAPSSRTEYAYFHVGEVECVEGDRIPVGRITFDTGHAGQRLSRSAALAHYDNTGKIGAYVVVGEDEHGGWVAGTLAATVTEDEAQTIRGSAPSGDWRDVNGNLELVALLCVNVPGFPVPRPRALVAAAEGEMHVLALTAAGVQEMLDRTEADEFREIEALAADARGDFTDLVEQARG